MSEGLQLPVIVEGYLAIADAVQSKANLDGETPPVDLLPDQGKLRLFLASD